MDNERTVKYNIQSHCPLVMDHNYAHCATIIQFEGFEPQAEGSTMYFLLGAPHQLMIPLTDDMEVLITREYTKRAGKIKGQLLECKLAEGSTDTYEFMRYSDIFHVIVTPSLAAASMTEVFDPQISLIYTQLHELYQKIAAYDFTHDAEAWAVGTREGVPTEDETYHNNAKWWSDLAKQSAEDSGFVWFEVNEEDGEAYVSVSDNLDEEASFEVNTTTGELEVTFA